MPKPPVKTELVQALLDILINVERLPVKAIAMSCGACGYDVRAELMRLQGQPTRVAVACLRYADGFQDAKGTVEACVAEIKRSMSMP